MSISDDQITQSLMSLGYRIRQLTAQEESEKVRDEVRRQREGEKMLVKSYKEYLKTLEGEIKRTCQVRPNLYHF